MIDSENMFLIIALSALRLSISATFADSVSVVTAFDTVSPITVRFPLIVSLSTIRLVILASIAVNFSVVTL